MGHQGPGRILEGHPKGHYIKFYLPSGHPLGHLRTISLHSFKCGRTRGRCPSGPSAELPGTPLQSNTIQCNYIQTMNNMDIKSPLIHTGCVIRCEQLCSCHMFCRSHPCQYNSIQYFCVLIWTMDQIGRPYLGSQPMMNPGDQKGTDCSTWQLQK